MKVGDRCALTVEGKRYFKEVYNVDLEVGKTGTVVEVIRRPVPYRVKFDDPIMIKDKLIDTFWQDYLNVNKLVEPIDNVLAEIKYTKHQAELKYGKNTHNYPAWIAIMTEELGKAATEANAIYFDTYINDIDKKRNLLLKLRKELIDLGQLVVATIEQIDSNLDILS